MDARKTLEALCDRLADLLARESPIVAWQDGRAAFEARLAEIERRAEGVEKILVVLLIGGTGVGKSTFLNALAREPIAAVSNARRAFTSKLNLYHHADVSIAPLVEGLGERYEAHVHRADALRDKVVIDAPDVDSIEVVHKELVQSFLPSVDLVLYLTSWQKYKNADVCAFLQSLKGNHFFLFALNQIDMVHQEDRAELVQDFATLLEGYGFARPVVLPISAKAAAGAHGRPVRLAGGGGEASGEAAPAEAAGAEDPAAHPDAGSFAQLDALLKHRIQRAEIRMIKERGLLSRLRTLLYRIGHAAAGEGAEVADLERRADALAEVAAQVEKARQELSATLASELEFVLERARARYERRYHELRDREAGGPYGLFLKLQERLGAEPIEGARSAAGQPIARTAQSVRLQAAIARALERARAVARPLAVHAPELDVRRGEDGGPRMLDAARRLGEETFLAELPPPRSPIAVNAAPTLTLLGALGVFLYLAAIGREPGVAYLVASLIATLAVCYAQFAVLRTLDRAHFRRLMALRAPDVNALVAEEPLDAALGGLAARLEAGSRQVRELARLAQDLEALRGEVRALPDEVSA